MSGFAFNTLPKDITDQFISHLHREYTYDVKLDLRKVELLCNVCNRFHHTFYIYNDQIHEITTQKGDIRTMKNLRLVSRNYANNYSIEYILKNIGGYFGRSKHYAVMWFNSNLARRYLIEIAARREFERMKIRINRFVKRHLGCCCGKISLLCSVQDIYGNFEENPMIIYDNDIVRKYLPPMKMPATCDGFFIPLLYWFDPVYPYPSLMLAYNIHADTDPNDVQIVEPQVNMQTRLRGTYTPRADQSNQRPPRKLRQERVKQPKNKFVSRGGKHKRNYR